MNNATRSDDPKRGIAEMPQRLVNAKREDDGGTSNYTKSTTVLIRPTASGGRSRAGSDRIRTYKGLATSTHSKMATGCAKVSTGITIGRAVIFGIWWSPWSGVS
jgi:hypothetical protein